MRLWWLLFLLFSSQLFAQSVPLSTALSLNPPPSDSSVIFLGNIFGVVDGVLSGTGSQIFGHMMQVFNAAILGLGSIIIMYTLIVGTLNTAQEGEFLGRQWSSVWIPVRCTTGLALLIPKATGYSLIQIFILWVIVQGVGAGDRIWSAALEYLNMGGKIVQAQQSSNDLINKTDTGAQTNDVLYGASVMLMGQVCMYGLQKTFEYAQQTYKDEANAKTPSGPCSGEVKDIAGGAQWTKFCSGSIPDFVATVDISKQMQENDPSSKKQALDMALLAQQQAQALSNNALGSNSGLSDEAKKSVQGALDAANAAATAAQTEYDKAVTNIKTTLEVKMPNFEDTSIFAFLNGYCGTLKWNIIDDTKLGEYQSAFSLSSENMSTLKSSRTVAVQTMFSNLVSVAYAMVSNNDAFSTTNTNDIPPQFGVALNSNEEICKSITDSCKDWGPLPNSSESSQVLFAGNEFVNALGSYAGLMMPVLNLEYQSKYQSFYKKARQFIDETERTGWIFAGAYFFKLVNLSGSPKQQAFSRDTDSGLDFSTDITGYALKDLKNGPLDLPTSVIANQLRYLNPPQIGIDPNVVTKIIALSQLIWGKDAGLSVSNQNDANNGYVSGYEESDSSENENSVLGFIRNSSMLDVGGQPGISGVKGIKIPRIISVVKPFKLPRLKKGCYGKIQIKIIKLKICLFNGFLDAAWAIISAIFNAIALAAYAFLWVLTQIMIVAPILMVIVPMINTAFKIINNMSLSPILDLANLGAYFIQTTLYSYFGLIAVAALAAIPYVGKVVDLMMAFMGPFYMTWLTYFLSIGFSTTFYVPMIPYIIFIFGAVAWIFLVIEAVLAGPLVALLMTSPEGEGLLGNKGEQGLILLVNLFLRPSLMIIGFITGIALSYVNIWMLNASYSIAGDYIRSPPKQKRFDTELVKAANDIKKDYKYQDELGRCHLREYNKIHTGDDITKNHQAQKICEEKMSGGGGSGGLEAPKEQGVDWDKYPFASLMGMIFYLVLYISMYTTIVQKGFQLIALLPDKVIRWIGGSESAGQEALRWEGEVAGQVKDAGKSAEKSLTGGLQGATEKLQSLAQKKDDKGDQSGSAKASGAAPPTPPPGGEGV